MKKKSIIFVCTLKQGSFFEIYKYCSKKLVFWNKFKTFLIFQWKWIFLVIFFKKLFSCFISISNFPGNKIFHSFFTENGKGRNFFAFLNVFRFFFRKINFLNLTSFDRKKLSLEYCSECLSLMENE